MPALTRTDVGGVMIRTVSVDPGNIPAGAQADVTVSVADVRANDQVIVAKVPAALEALVVQGVHTVQDGSFNVRLFNPTAGAIDAAAANWTFLIFRV